MNQSMLGMGKGERPNIPPRIIGWPNGGGNGASGRNGDSHDHGNSPNENGGSGGNGDPPDRRGGRPPGENGNPDGGGGDSDPDDSMDGDDSLSSSDSTLSRRREDPNMFMYCKGLQGHQARKGSLDKQEEMAEMGKPCLRS